MGTIDQGEVGEIRRAIQEIAVGNQKGALGGYKKGDLVKLEEIRDVTILIQDPQIRKRKSRSDQTTQLVENIQ